MYVMYGFWILQLERYCDTSHVSSIAESLYCDIIIIVGHRIFSRIVSYPAIPTPTIYVLLVTQSCLLMLGKIVLGAYVVGDHHNSSMSRSHSTAKKRNQPTLLHQ